MKCFESRFATLGAEQLPRFPQDPAAFCLLCNPLLVIHRRNPPLYELYRDVAYDHCRMHKNDEDSIGWSGPALQREVGDLGRVAGGVWRWSTVRRSTVFFFFFASLSLVQSPDPEPRN